MCEKKTYDFIDDIIYKIIKEPLAQQDEVDKKIEINKKEFILNIWSETIVEDNVMIIIEIRKIGLISDTVYTKGILYTESDFRIIDNAEMWDYGF